MDAGGRKDGRAQPWRARWGDVERHLLDLSPVLRLLGSILGLKNLSSLLQPVKITHLTRSTRQDRAQHSSEQAEKQTSTTRPHRQAREPASRVMCWHRGLLSFIMYNIQKYRVAKIHSV